MEGGPDGRKGTGESEGAAVVAALGEELALGPGERVEIAAGSSPRGPLDPARDLIRNGDFNQGLDNWASFAWRVELTDQPKGETSVTANGSGPVLRFAREGVGLSLIHISEPTRPY